MCRMLWLALLVDSYCWAQNDMIANINLQFQLSNPGARALAMGGAFVGLADDATAVFSNPAGMARLKSDLITLELGRTERDNEIPFYGGTIRQTGLQDFEYNLDARDFPENGQSVPFAAYLSANHRLKWGVVYAERAQFERSFQTQDIYLPHEPDDDRPVNDFTDFYFFPSNNHIDLNLRMLGMSGGISLNDNWSVGVTLAYSDFTYEGRTGLVLPDIFPAGHPLTAFVGQEWATIEVEGDDGTISGSAGFMYRPNESFSIGAAYRYQPDFDYDYQVHVLDFASETLELDDSGRQVFATPDSYGLGVAIKPNDTVVVSLEVNRVQYSELSDTYHQFFDSGGETQTVDDATEYRVGLEWFVTRFAKPLALRCGYWFEPYHALKNTYLDNQILYADDQGFQHIRNAVFLQQFEEDTDHLSLGFGLTLTQHFALDAAADTSSVSTLFSLSGIYRF
ncbi:MAG: outer membrane protein transport protein [Acidobacteria bacterium]|nr:outer membrane protein transport protein [Acidobacteriota bacterium]